MKPSMVIAALVLLSFAVAFAFQNAIPIRVVFLIWQFEGSLALVLVVTFVLGVVAGLLASIPRWLKRQS